MKREKSVTVKCDYTNCRNRRASDGTCRLGQVEIRGAECESVKPIYVCGDCAKFDTADCPGIKHHFPVGAGDDSGGLDGVCFVLKDGGGRDGVQA